MMQTPSMFAEVFQYSNGWTNPGGTLQEQWYSMAACVRARTDLPPEIEENVKMCANQVIGYNEPSSEEVL